jgi:hypothetical protein
LTCFNHTTGRLKLSEKVRSVHTLIRVAFK